MRDTFTFREGNGDIGRLKALGIASYGPYKSMLEEEGAAMLLANISNEETYRNLLGMSTLFTCEMENKIVGMAFYVASGHPTDIYEADWCYMRFLGVHPDFAGMGIARRLTSMCMERAVQTGEQTIALHTSEFMDAARHIYESMGFRQLRPIAPRFGKLYWLYTLNLNGSGS